MYRRLPLVLCLSALTACGASERRDVEKVLNVRAESLAAGDAVRYLTVISRTYQDKGKDFAAKRSELEASLKPPYGVSYRALNRVITIDGDHATATGSYLMKISRTGNPLELVGEEAIRLRREPGGWKIVGGL